MKLLPLIQDIIPVMPDSVPSVSKEMGMLRSLPIDELLNRFITGIVSLTINLLIAAIVFYAGKFIIKKIYAILSRILLHQRIDVSLTTFVLSFVRIVLYFILIVTVIGILGIETSSFLALFASAGVAIGMALSGTLQNFAGGVLILLLKPYRVGDYIEAQGFAGTVKEIQIFSTIILTPDNKSIIIPNGGLSTASINNYSREDYRRVDWSIGISYGDNVDTARSEIIRILLSDPRVVKEYIDGNDDQAPTNNNDNQSKSRLQRHRERIEQEHEKIEEQIKELIPRPNLAPSVVVDQLADSAVVLKIKAWARTSDYWGVYYAMTERFYNELPAAGINFPFPQLDVHLPQGSLNS
ncbi:MAG: mechanosensitive ion channel [Odoribacter sp.]|nr:mechanosensitive ion channel [Odoribacter sp.]